jgi:hypothetical protein
MAGGPYYQRTAGSLKAATSDLIEACGGAHEAALISGRVGYSMVNQYRGQSENELHVHVPVDIVERWERSCAAPIVTRWLAHAQGHALISLDRTRAANESYPAFTAKIGREAGELFAAVGDALSSGHVDARERAAIRKEASELMTVLSGLIAAIDAEDRRV